MAAAAAAYAVAFWSGRRLALVRVLYALLPIRIHSITSYNVKYPKMMGPIGAWSDG